MTAIKKYRPGEFCWTDLGTTDVAAAKKFYRGLFGWKVQDYSMGTGDAKYSIFRVDGKAVGALYPQPAGKKKSKAPPFWLPYIAVKNVEAIVKKAKAAGAKVCLEPTDVMDEGRMAILADPSGAAVAAWQAGSQPGAGLKDKPGTVCWHDLNTRKPAVAATFYRKVFGWAMQDKDFGGQAYHLFTQDDTEVCGMWPTPHPKLPPCWLTHWEVANCARTVAKARRLGGHVLMDAMAIPDLDVSFAVLTDPQGAAFGIIGK